MIIVTVRIIKEKCSVYITETNFLLFLLFIITILGDFNAASSMSAYTFTKRSLFSITDLLQLTDSEKEAGESGKYTKEYNMLYV